MVTLLLNQSKVIIQPMKDGNGKRTFELGPIVTMSGSPCDSNAKNKPHQIPHNKTHLFLVCLASKLRGNPRQAQVAPNGRRTYSESPPNTMSHIFQAQVNPLNQMRTLRLVGLSLLWLQHHPWRKLFACAATPPYVIIINGMCVGSPPPSTPTAEIPPSSSESPTTSSPHSHKEACQ
ncbi:hypothetical protein O181_022609 [Austropuccinia psidii MF-1]|uniref:Uncharacterized protein n=1 Tax=Austropuccinia psidii MF-1 TaxID=1389203 RepID=A0A9Q3CCX3_9BASI|nr:hypothetical protein [Austropuccinia psidii MF-1]